MEQLRDQPPDLRSLVQALWRRKWLFLGILVSIPVAVYLISMQVTKTFESSAIVQLKTIRTDVASLSAPSITDVNTEALLLNTQKVSEEAADAVGGGLSPGAVLGAVRTEPLTTSAGSATDLLLVVAQAESGQLAADLANAYGTAIDTVRTQKALRQLDESLGALQAQAEDTDDPATEAELARQLQLLRAARTNAEKDTEVVQTASVPDTPVSPHPRRNAALAGLVALLLALGAVAFAERMDRRLRDSSELEPLLDAPLLSVIPRGAFPGEKPTHGPVKEAFRTLAASLLYFNLEQPVSTVVVASPTKGDGKTTVAVHLAVALARDGKRVILVDCDLRHPQVALRLGIEPSAGIVDVLTEQAYLADALVDLDVGEGRLQVLAGGSPPPNPARLLGSQRMDSLLDKLSKRVDVVVVDTPPILHVSDAVPLLERVSGIVVVAKVGATTKDSLQRVRQVIETARGNILGAAATGSAGAGLYGYGSEYYGAEETAADLEDEPLPASTLEDEPLPEPIAEDEPLPEIEHERPLEANEPSEVEEEKQDGSEEIGVESPRTTVAQPADAGDGDRWRPPRQDPVQPAYGQPSSGDRPQSEPVTPAPAGAGTAAAVPPSGQLPPTESERDDAEPKPIGEEPTEEWDATEGWGASEEWRPPERWKAPETWDDPEAWDSRDED